MEIYCCLLLAAWGETPRNFCIALRFCRIIGTKVVLNYSLLPSSSDPHLLSPLSQNKTNTKGKLKGVRDRSGVRALPVCPFIKHN